MGAAMQLLLQILLVLVLTWHCGGQQNPPLGGQGVDPMTDSAVVFPVPVFMSVELQKLLVLDEQNYQFHALLEFQQSWADPRSASQFAFIDFKDQFDEVRKTVYWCATGLPVYPLNGFPFPWAPPNFTKAGCGKANWQPPPCSKYCKTVGSSTDNPWRCCDLIWLPDIKLRNQIDSSQDRVVYDYIWPFNDTGVHRQTRVLARFSTPLQFKQYPFDKQKLQVILEPNVNNFHDIFSATLSDPRNSNSGTAKVSYLSGPYFIVPSATFRRLNQNLVTLPNGTGQLTGSTKDDLAGWSIESVAFACANASGIVLDNGENMSLDEAAVSVQTQDFAPADEFENYYRSMFHLPTSPGLLTVQTCGLTISVARLSNTAVVQSIVPVAFIGLLAFVVFLSAPDALDVRVTTDVTLFLALTALQFVFQGALPLTSYLTNFDNFILLSYCLIMTIVLENLTVAYICTRPDHRKRAGKLEDTEVEATLSDGSFAKPECENTDANAVLDGAQNGQSTHAVSESARDGEELDLESEEGNDSSPEGKREEKNRRPATGWLCMPSSGANNFTERVQQARRSWRNHPQHAYRLAVAIDRVSAVVLLAAYITLGVLNFTVGFV